MLRRAVWIATAALAASCTEAPPSGCFNVIAGEWAPVDSSAVGEAPSAPPNETGDSVLASLPPRVRLDSTVVAGLDSFRVIAVPEDALQVPHSKHWWRSWSDSLELVFSNGYVGSVTRLVRGREDWAGRSETISDNMGDPLFARPVRLRSVACESPAPIPATADRPLLRSIPLADSRRLVLGKTIPAELETRLRRTGALTVIGTPTGYFAGSDTVVAVPSSDGTIRRIELLYPSGADVAGLLAHLKAQYQWARTSDVVQGVFWENRTTRLFLDIGAHPRLVVEDPRFH